MPDTKIKDRPKRLWKSLLRSMRPASSSAGSPSPNPGVSRTIKFSESVARFNYIVDDLVPKKSPDESRSTSTNENADVPADAIVFGGRPDLDFELRKQKATVPSETAKSKREAGQSSQSMGSQKLSAVGSTRKTSPTVKAPTRAPASEAKPFVPLRDLFELQSR